mmetsp:Transcript_30714/g.89121  ORF Transcript_30714/g.89121 Transcript_30714/m.89121 type:complete len:203 (-) Transcript_30714:578-1186(-)
MPRRRGHGRHPCRGRGHSRGETLEILFFVLERVEGHLAVAARNVPRPETTCFFGEQKVELVHVAHAELGQALTQKLIFAEGVVLVVQWVCRVHRCVSHAVTFGWVVGVDLDGLFGQHLQWPMQAELAVVDIDRASGLQGEQLLQAAGKEHRVGVRFNRPIVALELAEQEHGGPNPDEDVRVHRRAPFAAELYIQGAADGQGD